MINTCEGRRKSMNPIEQLREIINNSNNIVFFGGAGVSTESGIPDFRSVDGLYHQKYDYPPETILSHTFYRQKPEEFFRFYKDKMLCLTAKPNAAHRKLAEWEQKGKLKAVITQNIDGLHQKAGSKKVLELHGRIPKCDACGGRVKPDVVLYEEGLDQNTLQEAVHYIKEADVLIVGGTSLVVYPAAGLIDYYQGSKLILVNKTATARDEIADLVVQGAIGEIFSQL